MASTEAAPPILLLHPPDPCFLISLPNTFNETVALARKTFFLPTNAPILLSITINSDDSTEIALTESSWDYYKTLTGHKFVCQIEVKDIDMDSEMGKRMKRMQLGEDDTDKTLPLFSPLMGGTFENFPAPHGPHMEEQAVFSFSNDGTKLAKADETATDSSSSKFPTAMKLNIKFSCSLLDLHFKCDPTTLTIAELINEIHRRRPRHDPSNCEMQPPRICDRELVLDWAGEEEVTYRRNDTLQKWVVDLRKEFKNPMALRNEQLHKEGMIVHALYI